MYRRLIASIHPFIHALFVCLLGFTSIGCADEIQQQPPNIILIYADDLGYGDLSSYGATLIDTPHSDRVAQEGMLFTDAHSPSAVCTPSRYATLTGRYAWRTWLKNWVIFEQMPLLVETDRLTLPKLLKNQGYTTGIVGKWHLGWGNEVPPNFNNELAPGPLEIGFDYFYGVPFSHNSSLKLQNYVHNRRIVGLGEDEDIYDKTVHERIARRLEDTAIDLSEKAVEFIHTHKDEPFFLFYPTTNIHFPITPNERFVGQSDAGPYGDFVVEFDWAVGEILSALDELNLADNTLLIVTSDNGARENPAVMGGSTHDPNAPLKGTKRQIWEGGHRVPLVVRWPGTVRPGSVSDETISHTDLLPTLAAYFDAPLPNDAAEDGYNILPVLLEEDYDSPLREATVHHSVNGMFALRSGDWKLIEGDTDGDYRAGTPSTAIQARQDHPKRDSITGDYMPFYYDIMDFDPQNPVYRLYNLRQDPKESTDLAAEYPEKVAELTQLLNQYRDSGRSAPLN